MVAVKDETAFETAMWGSSPASIAARVGPSEYLDMLQYFNVEVEQSRDVAVIPTRQLHKLIEQARFSAILGYMAATERG